jgi:hypothetical protein
MRRSVPAAAPAPLALPRRIQNKRSAPDVWKKRCKYALVALCVLAGVFYLEARALGQHMRNAVRTAASLLTRASDTLAEDKGAAALQVPRRRDDEPRSGGPRRQVELAGAAGGAAAHAPS